ncbi:HlyD family secretion protein [Neorhodopirellula lusitana]|uniref:HlyD family secretion protein n=1 Tax=Neorhodopirellula lusitana TaxID=445327 RepID=A0ABY1Q7L0_9BACT|nr:HlyD family efflux transporter periplasmic adaptor subunit [Neorhodopirellula lusitana]SMP61355.1 HlyD family secretion protein [Neorhodopirellula lusitana]
MPSYHHLITIVLLTALCGCDQGPFSSASRQETERQAAAAQADSMPATSIVAQGTLRPRGGVLAVMAPPGDRVLRVAVREGDWVQAGDLLVELESFRVKTIELDVAETKLAEGKVQLAAEQASSNAKLQVARTKLNQAETQLRQSENSYKIADSPGGRLDLLRRAAELGQRKLDRLRVASNDSSTERLVSENKLEEESLRISETRAQYESARIEASDAIEAGRLAVLAAKQEIIAAEKSIEAAVASTGIDSLEKQIELLRLNLETARLVSPTNGRVLAVDTMTGQATTTMPLMHLADTEHMVCVAEINVADIDRIQPGQPAIIQSPGLSKSLDATVQRVHQMIAPPALPSPFPMAPVDRHTAEVTLTVADADAEYAAKRIQLQVEVTIDTSGDE